MKRAEIAHFTTPQGMAALPFRMMAWSLFLVLLYAHLAGVIHGSYVLVLLPLIVFGIGFAARYVIGVVHHYRGDMKIRRNLESKYGTNREDQQRGILAEMFGLTPEQAGLGAAAADVKPTDDDNPGGYL